MVLVITKELFDNTIGEHFRKLAIDLDKGHEMMLVVNKMLREAQGNNRYTQQHLTEDIENVISPFTADQLHLSFIDAVAAWNSKEEKDEEIKALLEKRSGINEFSTSLNQFISGKGLFVRLTTPLYELEQILQEAVVLEPHGDHDIDGMLHLLTQKRRALLETKNKVRNNVQVSVQKVISKINDKGTNIAELVHKSAKEDEVNDEIRKAQNEIERLTDKLVKDIEETFKNVLEELQNYLQDILDSEFVKNLAAQISSRILIH